MYFACNNCVNVCSKLIFLINVFSQEIICIFTGRWAESWLYCNARPTHDRVVASYFNNCPSPKISLIYWLGYA